MTETATPPKPTGKPRTAAAWAKRREHDVTLPSGAEVTICIPSLPVLLKAGQIPNELIAVAVKVEAKEDVTADNLVELAEFQRYLVQYACIAPEVTHEQVDDLPVEDVQMIVEFATRQRDMDALGHHLAGLEVTDEWKAFRDQQDSLASLLGGGSLR